MKQYVLSLCDRTGRMVEPFAGAGYQCVCVDIQAESRQEGNIEYVNSDVLEYLPPKVEYAFCFAFPPCTDLSSSGARWFKAKGLGRLAKSIALVDRCREIAEWTGAPWFIENPIGTLSTYWRKPDFEFDPADYAGYLEDPLEEAYTKRTCLWTGNGFTIPPTSPVFPIKGSLMYLMSPSGDRGDKRAVTPRGFAKACFLANANRSMEAA